MNKVLTLLIIVLACSCSSPKLTLLQPDKQPYRFQTVLDLPCDDVMLADLNGDGFTEIIAIDTTIAVGQSGFFLLLMTFEGKIIGQVNYAGRFLDIIHTLDYNNDGILEILVSFVRHDSLFVSFVNSRGEKLFYFFLSDGKPRIEDGGIFRWDPQVRTFYVRDLDNDGVKELITVITTGYARLPRGILVHSLPLGELIGKSIIGSPPRDNFMEDFDGDGQAEILCFGTAPDNGADAGGFNDHNSYLIMFDLTPTPQVAYFKQICKKFSNYYLMYEDIDGDAHKELIAWTEASSDRFVKSKIVELDPLTFNEIKARAFNTPLNSVSTANLNRDTQREIIIIQSPKKIAVLNHHLNEQQHRIFTFNLQNTKVLPDVDNDGIDEIIVTSVESEFLLDAKLKIKAVFPNMRCRGIIRRGETLSPQILVRDKNHFTAGQLIKNRFYLVRRYYSTVLYGITGAFLFALVMYIIRLQLRNRLLNCLQALVFDNDDKGLLLFDSNQRISMMNNKFRTWLNFTEPRQKREKFLQAVFIPFPEILTFIQETIIRPAHRYEKTFSLKLNEQKRKFQFILDPVTGKSRMKPFWLLTVVDKTIDGETVQSKTWCNMAQKTAHDIKNALSAIMLMFQRLQMLNQQQSEQAVLYVARIMERMESLRRISKNFMKFVNIEDLNLVNTDFNEFLASMVQNIRPGLPPDIQLRLQSEAALPMVKIDQDAMRSVVENLVSNAINAMPDGGQITISTNFFRGLVFTNNGHQAKDYVSIELRDTGVGISASDREHLFEPGFTNTAGGDGLGLAYVKKTVDDHGGYIEVESEPGAGTAFCIYLPTM